MTYTVSFTRTFDSLEDAVAAAVAAGGVYDDNAVEALEQGRKSEITLMTRDGDEIVIEATEG